MVHLIFLCNVSSFFSGISVVFFHAEIVSISLRFISISSELTAKGVARVVWMANLFRDERRISAGLFVDSLTRDDDPRKGFHIRTGRVEEGRTRISWLIPIMK